MVTIIEHGTLQIKKCNMCGCKFSFEDIDVVREIDDVLQTERRFISCPQCKEIIVLSSTK